MQIYRKILLTGIVFLLLGCWGYANKSTFEGFISFIKKTHFDTVHINYYVKNNKVRINQYSNEGILLHSLLIDILNEKVIALDPARKMYRVLNLNEKNREINRDRFVIKKTENHKEINGIKCYQWRVRNPETNSEIAYWVTHNKLRFMNDVIRLLSQTDRMYAFFSVISGTDGFFPVLSVERTLLRKERQRITVQKIDKKNIESKLFKIPGSYVRISR